MVRCTVHQRKDFWNLALVPLGWGGEGNIAQMIIVAVAVAQAQGLNLKK